MKKREIIDEGNSNNTYKRPKRRRAAAITTAPNIRRESINSSTQNKLKRNNEKEIRIRSRK